MNSQTRVVQEQRVVNPAVVTCGRPSPAAMGTVTNFARGATIFHEGDEAACSYKIISGAVRLSKRMSDGRRQVAEFALPGDYIGLDWLEEHAMTAEALTGVTLVGYTRGRLEYLGNENQAMRAELFSTLRHDLWAAQNHLVLLGRQSALERVACFLLDMLERAKSAATQAIIDIPMTRRDIADYLGLSLETVCRMLTRLKEEGIIGIPDRHSIMVPDLARLRRAANQR
jgi:CRP/FNR family nitrogen fixation transcriptional regulator